MSSRISFCFIALVWFSRAAFAIPNTASQIISYHPGGNASQGYRDPTRVLGLLDPIADPKFGNSVLTPFNPVYLPQHMCIIGDGGDLTLRLARPIASQAGPEIGVFCNNGLIDVDYPNGQNDNPAGLFSAPPRALVSVSADGNTFVPLSDSPITFDVPSNYYADLQDSPSFNTTGGSVVAAMDKPFLGHLSSFDGLDWPATRALLNGSAGGTWLDMTGSGVSRVQYVRFAVPAGVNYRMVLDAVSAAKPTAISPIFSDRSLNSTTIPEPSMLLAAAAALLLFARRR